MERNKMKRLIRKAEPITVYHGTNLLSLDKILQSGIAAGILEGYPWGDTTKTETFFTTRKISSNKYAWQKVESQGDRKDDCAVILTVDLDTDYLKPDNDDFPEVESLEESIELGQVAAPFSVLANQITEITFIVPESGQIECTKQEYLTNKEEYIKQIFGENNIQDEVDYVLYSIKKMNYYYDQIAKKVHNVTVGMDRLYVSRSSQYPVIEQSIDEKIKEVEQAIQFFVPKIISEVEQVNEMINKINQEHKTHIPFFTYEEADVHYYNQFYHPYSHKTYKTIKLQFGLINSGLDYYERATGFLRGGFYNEEEKKVYDIKEYIMSFF